ncbi:hypothetical protein Pcinc_028561 [Petrolisthes cinctipes]|uniref:Uncharacterized protein n=1 Tax=Petrolisthes cinctipes TaxID=88211 RepID=A0AAE1F248_PETCI|nr:hypothetical protein Pcinc_028561 [Petrolisthes cinctipes]
MLTFSDNLMAMLTNVTFEDRESTLRYLNQYITIINENINKKVNAKQQALITGYFKKVVSSASLSLGGDCNYDGCVGTGHVMTLNRGRQQDQVWLRK